MNQNPYLIKVLKINKKYLLIILYLVKSPNCEMKIAQKPIFQTSIKNKYIFLKDFNLLKVFIHLKPTLPKCLFVFVLNINRKKYKKNYAFYS